MLRFDFTDSIGLHNVLSFFTGAEIIPPLGFEITPSLRFSDSMLPTASTCALQLVLPTSYYNNGVTQRENDLCYAESWWFWTELNEAYIMSNIYLCCVNHFILLL